MHTVVGVAAAAFVAVGVMCCGGVAHGSSQSYGGSYEQDDDGVCNNGNTVAGGGGCSCPAGYTPRAAARVVNDIMGGYIYMCDSGAIDNAYGGTFQRDDDADGGQGCRIPNVFSGGCECPSGFVTTYTRVIADTSTGGLVGSHLGICCGPDSLGSSSTFGCAWELQDDVGQGTVCMVSNPYSGSCSCGGDTEDWLRVHVDASEGIVGAHIVTCGLPKPESLVEICSGIYADNTGQSAADSAIQTCITQAGIYGTVSLPAGTYLISSQIVVNTPVTLRTSGSESLPACKDGASCAVLLASPTLFAFGGLLLLEGSGIVIDHIVIDGNRAARVGSAAWNQCSTGSTRYGYNMQVSSCTNCTLTASVSRNTVCGSSCEWSGDSATITNNLFGPNGDHNTNMMWSDGLTLLSAHSTGFQTQVIGNYFQDNSDVDLICGGAQGATISYNTFYHSAQPAFAGLMLDNFDGSTSGDFRNTAISGNSVSCKGCTYGINLGPHGWYLSSNIIGGNVTKNYVEGAYFLVNADGAGTSTYPIGLLSTSFGSPQSGRACGYASTQFVLCSDSVVSPLDIAPTLSACLHGCVWP